MSHQSDEFFFKYLDGSWCIHASPGVTVRFEQAIVDAVYIKPGVVQGYPLAIHGFPDDVFKLLDADTVRALGLGYPSRLGGQPRGFRRLRLLANGNTERMPAGTP